MPKRRRSRRRHERRAHAPPAERPTAPPAAAAVTTRRISWVGLIGALLGFAPMAALTVEILAEPPDIGRATAAVPALMAALYVPALWASVLAGERRRTVFRASLIASIVMAFVGGALFGPTLFIVLLPATALLWLAAGRMRAAR